jgi:magnesium-transporting ATPase (P-type)
MTTAGDAVPGVAGEAAATDELDPRRPLEEMFRDLRTSPRGLSSREAGRRQLVYGPNELTRRGGRRWPRQLLAQFTQPMALLLAAAAVLAWVGGTPALSVAVVAVVLLNAGFAFLQEMQAERAVEALAAFLPATAVVLREGVRSAIAARDLVPGDVLVVAEGDRVPADARIIEGSVQMDLSALTGESVSSNRSAAPGPLAGSVMDARDLVFSGTSCTSGEATTVVTHTAMHTELGRIAALSQRTSSESSPLERQVRRATWIIAAVAVVVGAAFLPLGLVAGLSWSAGISFSIGLIVANVPEGLLPTITLALAAGVRELARRGAVVKRLSAVETLGSTTVICTDKTGTLTQNKMRVTTLWACGAEIEATANQPNAVAARLIASAAACTTADAPTTSQPGGRGDPTELALLLLAGDMGLAVSSQDRATARISLFAFDAHLKRMSTVDRSGEGTTVNTKGAPETVLPLCTQIVDQTGSPQPKTAESLSDLEAARDRYAARGLRVLAVAARTVDPSEPVPDARGDASPA